MPATMLTRSLRGFGCAVVVVCSLGAAGCEFADEAVLEQWQSCEPPLILGHRGTRSGAPENTLPAFRWAMDHGADGVELDVKTTKDGQLVVLHDKTTGRTTDDADDRDVKSLDFGPLRLLDAGSWFAPQFKHTKIPTLEEAVAVVDDAVLIDIDHLARDNVADVAAFIDAHGLADRVVVSSYDEVAVEQFTLRAPGVDTVLFLGDTALEDLEDKLAAQTAFARPTFVRVPKNLEEDPRALAIILGAGFQPAMSGSKSQWVGGLVYADNAEKSREVMQANRPAWCR